MLLAPDQMAELAPRMQALDRRAPWVALLSWWILAAMFAFGMRAIAVRLQQPTVNALYDNRSIWDWLGPAVMLAFVAGYIPTRAYIRWRMEGDLVLHDRYVATERGHDDRRAMKYLAAAFIVFGIALGVLSHHLNVIVDDRGITFTEWFCRNTRQGYEDVTGVQRYAAVKGWFGDEPRENLRITFGEGRMLDLLEDQKELTPSRLEILATTIATRAGLPISRGAVRP